ncbi:hypothetical protein SAMD00019534_072180 [Acytostelium subglobosum LB1]|uniref:hypothetical protein n=1 Tax=Acytostelium subglobosum LB1 TaxID=1410327 RepID=UPI000644D3C3|nr:hypothetical protein SAMD00019534_072180 [Acytostelium subglobosum LB1]GAM24043.1 hypothetical protein SAMD00019534_072180 [Acytostelium subglobosum LB1]|eukprot:XP_012753079.1 hypothetical protein SAMD00019534_072180 [Acytostelium subglobosum LB1]
MNLVWRAVHAEGTLMEQLFGVLAKVTWKPVAHIMLLALLRNAFVTSPHYFRYWDMVTSNNLAVASIPPPTGNMLGGAVTCSCKLCKKFVKFIRSQDLSRKFMGTETERTHLMNYKAEFGLQYKNTGKGDVRTLELRKTMNDKAYTDQKKAQDEHALACNLCHSLLHLRPQPDNVNDTINLLNSVVLSTPPPAVYPHTTVQVTTPITSMNIGGGAGAGVGVAHAPAVAPVAPAVGVPPQARPPVAQKHIEIINLDDD